MSSDKLVLEGQMAYVFGPTENTIYIDGMDVVYEIDTRLGVKERDRPYPNFTRHYGKVRLTIERMPNAE